MQKLASVAVYGVLLFPLIAVVLLGWLVMPDEWKKKLAIFRTDARPSRLTGLILSSLLFVLFFGAYVTVSNVRDNEAKRRAGNEEAVDKIVPKLSMLFDGIKRVAIQPEEEGEELRLWVDTGASIKRFGIALAFMFLAIIVGLNMGTFPYLEALFYRFFLFFDKIPALCVLPILFITIGLGELSKVVLIIIGVFPTVALDAYLRAKAIPEELIQKAKTLGASEQEICYRVILPQIFPKMLDTIRLNLKSMVLLLIAGESIAASAGLGYRIFVVRRYMAMDIIIPYVLWITMLLFVTDLLFQVWIKRYPWLDKQ